MNRLTKDRINKRKTLKGVWGIAVSVTTVITTFIILDILKEPDFKHFSNLIIPIIIFNALFIIVYLLIREKKIKFNQNDKDIFYILLAFLKENKTAENKILSVIEDMFSSHPKKELNKLFSKNKNQIINLKKSCNNLANQSYEIRLYVIYYLLDIASSDKIYSIKEEVFIEIVRKQLKIHPDTFKYIKNSYLKKGLKEERKIIEEQNRKKIAKSFLPYNAYKILGVSPTVKKLN